MSYFWNWGCILGAVFLIATQIAHIALPIRIALAGQLGNSGQQKINFWIKYDLGQRYYATQVRSEPGFELMTSRSWQFISCHWDACSNHLAISEVLQPAAVKHCTIITRTQNKTHEHFVPRMNWCFNSNVFKTHCSAISSWHPMSLVRLGVIKQHRIQTQPFPNICTLIIDPNPARQ